MGNFNAKKRKTPPRRGLTQIFVELTLLVSTHLHIIAKTAGFASLAGRLRVSTFGNLLYIEFALFPERGIQRNCGTDRVYRRLSVSSS